VPARSEPALEVRVPEARVAEVAVMPEVVPVELASVVSEPEAPMSEAVITPAMPPATVGKRLAGQEQDQGHQGDREALKHTPHASTSFHPF
jgi:hypothetical protein